MKSFSVPRALVATFAITIFGITSPVCASSTKGLAWTSSRHHTGCQVLTYNGKTAYIKVTLQKAYAVHANCKDKDDDEFQMVSITTDRLTFLAKPRVKKKMFVPILYIARAEDLLTDKNVPGLAKTTSDPYAFRAMPPSAQAGAMYYCYRNGDVVMATPT